MIKLTVICVEVVNIEFKDECNTRRKAIITGGCILNKLKEQSDKKKIK